EAAEPGEDPEPRLLRHLLRHGVARHVDPRQADHGRVVTIDEIQERGLVAALERRNEIGVLGGRGPGAGRPGFDVGRAYKRSVCSWSAARIVLQARWVLRRTERLVSPSLTEASA